MPVRAVIKLAIYTEWRFSCACRAITISLKSPSLDRIFRRFGGLRLNAAIVDTHRCARVLTGAKLYYFTTGKSPLFCLVLSTQSCVLCLTDKC